MQTRQVECENHLQRKTEEIQGNIDMFVCGFTSNTVAAVAQWVRAFTQQAESWYSIPSRDRPVVKTVVTAPLRNALVLGNG